MNEEQALHLKYRPTTLQEVAGNRVTLRALESTLSKPARPHSYLLTGPSGCGKTTIARIIANMLGCSKRDYHEMNSASYRGIDSVREMIAASVRRPWEGKVTVRLLDECHALTDAAQNSILKLLEEPPRHAYYLLATTDPEKLKQTIKTRCAHFNVVALPPAVVKKRLEWVCDKEDLPEEYPTDGTLSEIGRLCGGSMRQALMMLDQVVDIEDQDEAIEALAEVSGDDFNTRELCRLLDKPKRWEYVQEILKGITTDPETTRRGVLGYFNTIMLNSKGATLQRAITVARHFEKPMLYGGGAALTLATWDALQEVGGDKV